MRVHAYPIPSRVYGEIEGQVLDQIREGDRDQLVYLLSENLGEVELLSGEWRVLFDDLADFVQFVDLDERTARMAISPDEMLEFTRRMYDPALRDKWRPLAVGLSTVRHNLDPETGAPIGLVLVEESDDWMWAEQPYEMFALRPEVWRLLRPHFDALVEAGDYAVIARLVGDHCECSVEFSEHRWELLRDHAHRHAPKLLKTMDGMFSAPEEYTSILEALRLVADARYQPSLEAWVRVHAPRAEYGLFFRDVEREAG